MRVAITGATGLVGRRLAAALHERGDEVVVLTRDPRREHGLPAVATEQWSPGVPFDPAKLYGVDGVVHLAGEPVQGRWTARKKASIIGSREEGTRGLVNAISAARKEDPERAPKVLVSSSAIGWYGERGDDELREAEPPGSDFLAEVCQAWEREATPISESGARLAVIRIGLVLAPEGGALKEMRLPFSLGIGGPIGSGQQWWSWIHISDLIGILLRGLDDESWSGVFNATAPNPIRQRDFARALGRALGRPSFMPAPRFAVKLALGEFSTELLTSKRVLPAALEAAGYEFRFPELEPALADLLSLSPA